MRFIIVALALMAMFSTASASRLLAVETCVEPAGDPRMVAGINSKNPTACNLLPMFGCTTLLTSVPQLDIIPLSLKEGLTVADLCPCRTCAPSAITEPDASAPSTITEPDASAICVEPVGDPIMVAGINKKNPTACNLLPMFGCTTLLTSVPELDDVPKNFKEGLTVADLCPCRTCAPSTITEPDASAPSTITEPDASATCVEPAGDPRMVAGINKKNPAACNLLPMLFGCTTLLTGVSQLDDVPKNFKEGLTVADLCPCGTCAPSTITEPDASEKHRDQPNIIFTITDDFPFFNTDDIPAEFMQKTPIENLQKMKQFRSESVIFKHSFSNAISCTPARTAALTGRYASMMSGAQENAVNGIGFVPELSLTPLNPNLKNYNRILEEDEDFVRNGFVKRLQKEGYHTCFVGKWHLEKDEWPKNGPNTEDETWTEKKYRNEYVKHVKSYGFDYVDGLIVKNLDYFAGASYPWPQDKKHSEYWQRIAGLQCMSNAIAGECAKRDFDACEEKSECVLKTSTEQDEQRVQMCVKREPQPFFLWYATTLIHTPDSKASLCDVNKHYTPYGFEWNPKDYDSGLTNYVDNQDTFKSMTCALSESSKMVGLKWFDDTVTAMDLYLKHTQSQSNTAWVMSADHGQTKGEFTWEGLRMPMMIRYPPITLNIGGSHSDKLVSMIDFAPTFLTLAGIEDLDQYMGESFIQKNRNNELVIKLPKTRVVLAEQNDARAAIGLFYYGNEKSELWIARQQTSAHSSYYPLQYSLTETYCDAYEYYDDPAHKHESKLSQTPLELSYQMYDVLDAAKPKDSTLHTKCFTQRPDFCGDYLCSSNDFSACVDELMTKYAQEQASVGGGDHETRAVLKSMETTIRMHSGLAKGDSENKKLGTTLCYELDRLMKNKYPEKSYIDCSVCHKYLKENNECHSLWNDNNFPSHPECMPCIANLQIYCYGVLADKGMKHDPVVLSMWKVFNRHSLDPTDGDDGEVTDVNCNDSVGDVLTAEMAKSIGRGRIITGCTTCIQMLGKSTCETTIDTIAETFGISAQSYVGYDSTSKLSSYCPVACNACSDGDDGEVTDVVPDNSVDDVPASGMVQRDCDSQKTYNAIGLKIAIICTSHDKLGDENCTDCKPTGIASTEMSVPYYIFKDAGAEVTLYSVKGGNVPVDIVGKYLTSYDTRFWSDTKAMSELANTKSVKEVPWTGVDAIYFVGGWGAAWDFGTDPTIKQGVYDAYKANLILSSVCHGCLGFIQTKSDDGTWLIANRAMTGVTNRQIEQLEIAQYTPMHPEDELKKRGVKYECEHANPEVFASYLSIDGNFITGQNQNSACQVSQAILDRLSK